MITFTDKDGRRWKVKLRQCYRTKIKTVKQLKAMQVSASEHVRSLGHVAWADTIDSQTFIRWAQDSGVIFWKKRIVK